MDNNPLLKTDGYKLSHWNQFPDGTEFTYYYAEPRKGPGQLVVMGINEFVQQIIGSCTFENIGELEDLAETYGIPFNKVGWNKLGAKYALTGEFPLLVRGFPEGTVVMPGTPVASIANTDPDFPWLAGFFETLMLRCIWYPSSVAGISRDCKIIIKHFLSITADNTDGLPYKLHDFGARGVSSGESAGIGGAAHLINFDGTDTLEARAYIRDNHNNDDIGHSIAATEHSTTTSWERPNEGAFYDNFIARNLSPGSIGACVIDSYNDTDAVEMIIRRYPAIKATGGTFVLRPDSGNPVATPIRIIDKLLHEGGFTLNSKKFKMLPDFIRVIQGDGIDLDSIGEILEGLKKLHICTDNIAFGMGGGLLQHVDRDTYGWAMKCSWACVNGVWRDVYKDPVGGGKTSKRGDQDNKDFVTYYNGLNSTFRCPQDWSDIRQRAEVS